MELKLAKDTFVWRAGCGYEHYRRGRVFRGELVNRSNFSRVAVIRTESGMFRINYEDLERPFDATS